MSHLYPPIGVMKTCFTEKFGVPRQSMMIPAATGILKLNPDPKFTLAIQRLETFSHIWVLFVFDRSLNRDWHPIIQPPRTEISGGVGVFASRSPHRPNPIGLSAVKLEKIDFSASDGIEIHVSGVDILDGTPVLDIKPYLPYADIIPNASEGWARAEITRFPVTFSPESLAVIRQEVGYPQLQDLLEQMLAWDPRPLSQRKSMPIEDSENEGKIFRFRIYRFDVEWQIRDRGIHILHLLGL